MHENVENLRGRLFLVFIAQFTAFPTAACKYGLISRVFLDQIKGIKGIFLTPQCHVTQFSNLNIKSFHFFRSVKYATNFLVLLGGPAMNQQRDRVSPNRTLCELFRCSTSCCLSPAPEVSVGLLKATTVRDTYMSISESLNLRQGYHQPTSLPPLPPSFPQKLVKSQQVL